MMVVVILRSFSSFSTLHCVTEDNHVGGHESGGIWTIQTQVRLLSKLVSPTQKRRSTQWKRARKNGTCYTSARKESLASWLLSNTESIQCGFKKQIKKVQQHASIQVVHAILYWPPAQTLKTPSKQKQKQTTQPQTKQQKYTKPSKQAKKEVQQPDSISSGARNPSQNILIKKN